MTQTSITMKELKEKIPLQCFNKSLSKSLFYFFLDLLLLSTAFFTYDWFSTSWLGLLFYWNIYGFLMWCVFVVGHDCGHGSFSNYRSINALCGHLCHGILCVPFWPWAYSHRLHHQNHNHLEKDKSFNWYTKERWNNLSLLKKLALINPIAPFYIYFFYILGMGDGSHFFPGKLYKGAPKEEKIKCLISSLIAIFFLSTIAIVSGSFTKFFLFYGVCWSIFSFWLILVTYMQHHSGENIIFDSAHWNYLDGALETIDRRFGFGIDHLHHHISDCHLVHHLFFTQIPHYHLKEATESINKFLDEKGLYHYHVHNFFIYDFFKLFFTVNFTKWRLNGPKKIENKS